MNGTMFLRLVTFLTLIVFVKDSGKVRRVIQTIDGLQNTRRAINPPFGNDLEFRMNILSE